MAETTSPHEHEKHQTQREDTSAAAEEPIRVVSAPEGFDVERIMAEVRQLVAQRKQERIYEEPKSAEARCAFGAEWVTSVGEQLDLLRAAARLELQGDPIRSHRPFSGRFIVAWKKFVRFWVRKYTDAIFLRQSFFNSQVVAAVEKLEQRIDALEDEVALLRAQLNEVTREELHKEKGAEEKKNRP
ncbi:MAG: hypothetical protein N2Z21_08505 [Candidatus Sumerlaeaceae bacterium]|nr:hypothetical protein [Candidatus Sumerlaeaceae bacterium]